MKNTKPAKWMTALLSLALLAPLGPREASGAIYEYHPKSRLYLGGGYNPFHPDKAFLRCIDYDSVVQVDAQGAVSSRVKLVRLTSRSQFYKETSFSASIEGSYAFYSGGGSLEMEDSSAFQQDSFTWMLLFESNYGRFVLQNPRLQSSLIALDGQALAARCGNEIVTEATKSVSAYALFTIKNMSESQRSRLESSFRASASAPFWSADLNSSYTSFMATALATSQVEMRMGTIGGEGVPRLAALLDAIPGAKDDPYAKFERIPVVLQEYIKDLTAQSAVPVNFNTIDLRAFSAKTGPTQARFKAGQVSEMFSRYADYLGIINRIRSILYGSESTSYALNGEQAATLQRVHQAYSNNANAIFQVAQACFDPFRQNECVFPPEEAVTFTWPKRLPDPNVCVSIRDRAADLRLVNEGEYQMARRRNFVPLFVNTEAAVQISGWVRCEDFLKEN